MFVPSLSFPMFVPSLSQKGQTNKKSFFIGGTSPFDTTSSSSIVLAPAQTRWGQAKQMHEGY
eukprot:COSAG06_NODE_20432_length_796_cov_1.000000_2_plen_61_part_01